MNSSEPEPASPEGEARQRRSGGVPLADRTVVVTRPPRRADALTTRLRTLGARVLEAPTIVLADPPDPGPLNAAARTLEEFDWLVFTSPAGVRQLERALARETGRSLASISGPRVAAIGPSTAETARAAGLTVDLVPGSYRAESLLAALRRRAGAGDGGTGRLGGGTARTGPLDGVRFLLPRAAEARDVLPDGLAAAGAMIRVVTAYRAVPPEPESLASLRDALASGTVDWITFTASSTVRNFVELVGAEVGDARVAAIGPVTAGTARDLGLEVDAMAEEYTIAGLVDALLRAEAPGVEKAGCP